MPQPILRRHLQLTALIGGLGVHVTNRLESRLDKHPCWLKPVRAGRQALHGSVQGVLPPQVDWVPLVHMVGRSSWGWGWGWGRTARDPPALVGQVRLAVVLRQERAPRLAWSVRVL